MTFWYTVGEEKVYDKLQAIEKQLKSGGALHFHCPETYDNYDFSHEPKEDLITLLKTEAILIREKYKKDRL